MTLIAYLLLYIAKQTHQEAAVLPNNYMQFFTGTGDDTCLNLECADDLVTE